MSNIITLYDIPNKSSTKDKAWSPNTWKTRFALNFKGIPYRTEWVEYPDIEKLCKELGTTPSMVPFMRRPTYTLPVIHDPSTNTAVDDSQAIARYLDKTYPDTPRLIPPGTDVFHAAFDYAISQTIASKSSPIALYATCALLSPRSEEYFRRTRAEVFGKLEDLSPAGPVREKHMQELQDAFSLVAQWLEADGVAKPFVMGDTISYADLTLAAWIVRLKRVLGPESQEWQTIQSWNGGRWKRFMDSVAQYEVVP